jgi:DNA modification methylase
MGVIRKNNIRASEPQWSEEDRVRLNSRIKATQVEHVSIGSLKPNSKNAKKHPQKQIELLAENIRKFGVTQPLVVDEDYVAICGHARLEALMRVGVEVVPIIRLTHLSGHEKRALAIADNRLSELGEWDVEVLREDLKELTDPTVDFGFDFEITGFDSVDVDALIEPETKKEKEDPADVPPPLEDRVPAITQPRDVWLLGQHVLLCGDARSATAYNELMNGSGARLVFTDPPYNVKIGGNVTKRRDVPEFQMASGEMTEEDYTKFLGTTLGHVADHAERGAVVYVCIDHAHLPELLAAAKPILGPHKNLAVWVKSNFGLGSFYRSQHEMIPIFVLPGAPPINNFGLGKRGRVRTNVWNYPGLNAFSADRAALLAMHPTIKPVAMVADAIRDCSNRNDVVLDPFGGSGTTLIACEKVGRKARLIELDPHYCDVIVRRFEKFTGEAGRLAATGATFSEVVDRRQGRVQEGD